jgi:hypothetical protein
MKISKACLIGRSAILSMPVCLTNHRRNYVLAVLFNENRLYTQGMADSFGTAPDDAFYLEEAEIERTVEVIGVPSHFSEDYLYLSFESDRYNGGEVENIRRLPRSDALLVTFADKAVVPGFLDCLEKKPMVILGQLLTVHPYQPYSARRTILVSGLGGRLDIDELTLPLENRRKGGGKVESVDARYDGSALVTFVDDKVARNWATVGKLQYVQMTLRLSWPATTHGAECRVLYVVDVSASAREELELALESTRNGGGSMEGSEHQADGTLVVTFEKEIVAKRLAERGFITVNDVCYKICQIKKSTKKITLPANKPPPHPCMIEVPHAPPDDESCNLQASMHYLTSTMPAKTTNKFTVSIQVSNITPAISEKLLLLYFENEKFSSGGSITHMQLDAETGIAVITFQHAHVGRRVLEKKTPTE